MPGILGETLDSFNLHIFIINMYILASEGNEEKLGRGIKHAKPVKRRKTIG